MSRKSASGRGRQPPERDSGYSYSGTSRSDGRYTLSGILPGTYDITAEMPGFAAEVKRGLSLQGRRQIRHRLQAANESRLKKGSKSPPRPPWSKSRNPTSRASSIASRSRTFPCSAELRRPGRPQGGCRPPGLQRRAGHNQRPAARQRRVRH